MKIEERYFHDDHQILKPSGAIGHGLGIIGSLLMIIGVSAYMARKRFRWMSRLGLLKHWLEFHIFLCTLGPILVLFHTAFKFGGIVAISFWSMVAVFLSGVIGRFIYIQIPRTIEGRELSQSEVRDRKRQLEEKFEQEIKLNSESMDLIQKLLSDVRKENNNIITGFISNYFSDIKRIKRIKTLLKRQGLARNEIENTISLVKNDISLSRKINRLNMMQNLFKYWHVAHLPFALVMLIIMVIHVVVTIVFGYKWIF